MAAVVVLIKVSLCWLHLRACVGMCVCERESVCERERQPDRHRDRRDSQAGAEKERHTESACARARANERANTYKKYALFHPKPVPHPIPGVASWSIRAARKATRMYVYREQEQTSERTRHYLLMGATAHRLYHHSTPHFRRPFQQRTGVPHLQGNAPP